MKTLLAAILAIIGGLATGLGVAALRVQMVPWDGDPGGRADNRGIAGLPDQSEFLPKVAVDRTEYDFGTMDLKGEETHDFLFTNTGEGLLVLTAGGSTCSCAVAKFEKRRIPPGQSGKVTVTWKPREEVGPYRESARIRTNDPTRPGVNLTIKGRISVATRAVPPELAFGRVSAGQSAAAETSLFCYLDEPFQIRGYRLLTEVAVPEFEVEILPLPAERLEEEIDAHGGRLLRVTLKPGLPLGAFRRTIQVETNLKAVPTLLVPIVGVVGRDISVAGPGWNDETGVLRLGTVSSLQGLRRRLLLIARGPHRKEVRFKPVQCIPDLLKVAVGKTTDVNRGKATQTALLIEIPKGSPRANYLGSEQGTLGQITIETNHAELPQIRIRVSFAVEG